MKNNKIISIISAFVVLLIITIVTVTAFADNGAEAAPFIGKSLSELQSKENYGKMEHIETNDIGSKKYMDDRYVYWFNANDQLISRVLFDVSSQTQKKDMTRDAALQLATKEIGLYIDSFKITEVMDVNINKNNESNTPWEISFIMRNEDNVAYNTYEAVIDIYGDVCLLFISEQQPAKEKMCINETSAYNLAIEAIAKNLSTTYKKDIKAKDISIVSIVNEGQDLFAYEGRSIWSFALNNFIVNEETYEYTYFVQVDAISGEIIYIGTCRNGVQIK